MLFHIKKITALFFIFCAFFSIQSYAQQIKGTVQIESSAEIDQLIAQKKQYNQNLKSIKGYKIQLFYGNEKGAYEINDKFKALFPDISTKIVFVSPEWKVQVGDFVTQLEADKSLVEIEKEFPGAIVLSTEIEK